VGLERNLIPFDIRFVHRPVVVFVADECVAIGADILRERYFLGSRRARRRLLLRLWLSCVLSEGK